MRVFKFGGASVKDAASVRNIPGIISKYSDDGLVIVISAMGKITNAMEQLAKAAYYKDAVVEDRFQELEDYHMEIARDLFPDPCHPVFEKLKKIFAELKIWTDIPDPGKAYVFDMYYDQIVPSGELLSTTIVNAYLESQGYKVLWADARELIISDNTYRSAEVDWQQTTDRIIKEIAPALKQGKIIVSQGFIGSNLAHSTTLGREGSDYTAAIFANILDATEVLVWKDVPGYLNADPDYFDDTVKLDKISYQESIELAFYGAKIIHPKTIRPLKNKNIPLLVKSFLDPETDGSIIHHDISRDALVPSYIIKEQQVLISISSRDFSFIAEDNLHKIFGIFAAHRISINLMQNSAISFSVCVDESPRLDGLIKELQQDFQLRYNEGLKLISIRHYKLAKLDEIRAGKEILLEQKSRRTLQIVVKG